MLMKIAVGRALEDAYGFAFKRFFSVLGTVWFPYLVLLVIFACVLVPFFAQIAPMWLESMKHGSFERHTMDPEMVHDMLRRMSGLLGLAPLLILVVMVVRSMVLVGLLQLALGRRKGPVFAYFSLGAPVWRMLGALLLAFIIIWVLAAILAGACVAIWFAVNTLPQANLIRVAAIVVAACLFIYAMFRLVFFVPAVVVAEERIDLGRSWQLGGGNFWRIILTILATFIPAAIIFTILSGAIRSAMFMPLLPHFGDHPTPQLVWSIMTHQGAPYIVVSIILQLVYYVIFSGLGVGMIASAYRSVVPSSEPAEEPAGMVA